jgi:membrane protein Man1
MNELTNQELLDQLKKYGISAGPVNESTRFLYENRLKKLIEDEKTVKKSFRGNHQKKHSGLK